MSRAWKLRPGLFAALLLTLPLVGTAAHDPHAAWQRSKSIRAIWDNDLFDQFPGPGSATDQYYTNGTRIEVTWNWHRAGGGPAGGPPDTILPHLFWWPFSLAGWSMQHGRNLFEGISFGQSMYTPTDISRSEIQFGDRPYSAWVGLGAFWGVNRVSKDHVSQHRLDFEAGRAGDHALGREVQTIIHEYISNSPLPQGWGNQNHSEPAAVLAYNYKSIYQVHRFVQAGYHGGLNLGNVHTNLKLGTIFKVGLLDLSTSYGKNRGTFPEPILAAAPPNSRGSFRERYRRSGFQIGLLVNPSITFVAYNAHLEGGAGNPNRSSPVSYDFTDYVLFNQTARFGTDLERAYAYQMLFIDRKLFPDQNKFSRYRWLYRPYFNADNAIRPATDFLIFNTLYNGGQELSAADKRSIMDSMLQEPIADEFERLFVISALQANGRPMPLGIRFLAYYLLVTRTKGSFDGVRDTFAFYYLFLKKEPEQTYSARKAPFFGTLRTGITMEWGDWSMAYILHIRSREFYGRHDLPKFHRYGQVQVSYRW